MNFVTKKEVEIIRSSWERLLIKAPGFGEAFYARVFSLSPAASEMFRKDIRKQAELFIMSITHIVRKIDDWEKVADDMQVLGKAHFQEHKIKTEYFKTFKFAFFDTLEQSFDEEWVSVKSSWVNFYMLLIDVMFHDDLDQGLGK